MTLISKTLMLVNTPQINQYFRFLHVLLEVYFAHLSRYINRQSFLSPLPSLSPHHKLPQQQVGYMEKDFEMAIFRAGCLLGSALGTNICEDEQEAGLTRGRNSNHDAITSEAPVSPTSVAYIVHCPECCFSFPLQ